MVYLVSRDKSIQTLRIHQFEAKMGKYFAVDEAVVGKIKSNLICSRSVVHVVGAYVISVGLTLSVKRHYHRKKSRAFIKTA